MKIAIPLLPLVLLACSSSSSDTTSASTSTSASASMSSSSGGGSGGSTSTGTTETFTLTSPAFADEGELPAEYTCDGVGHSPALAWSGAPVGTVEFALMMTTQAKDGPKWNWVLYGIPADVASLEVGSTGVGNAGLTSDGPNLAYSPPCSQGPGAKTYTFTIHALSATPTLPSDPKAVTGPVLTSAIESLTLASSALDVSYTRM